MKRPRGVGLYSWRQVRYDNAITFTAGIIVGCWVALIGVGVAWYAFDLRRIEAEQFGQADPHFWIWLGAFGLLLLGIFWAHAGVIYWCRRLFRHKRT